MLAAEPKVARAEAADSLKANPNRSWKHFVEPLEPFLQAVSRHLNEQVNDFDPQIVPYAQYALNGSGKHLRPTLVALAANAVVFGVLIANAMLDVYGLLNLSRTR